MSRAETQRQLQWLMAMRVVTVTTLLICAFAVEFLLRPAETLRPLFTLAAVTYGMALLYGVLDRWLSGSRSFIALQLVGDALAISLFVGITGGVESPMSFLYILPISVGSLLLWRGGGLAMAGVCWVLYAALVVIGPVWYPAFSPLGLPLFSGEPGRAVYFLVAHLVAMIAFALLSSNLSERIQAQGRELVERRSAVERLKVLNENIIGSISSGLITTDGEGRINFMNRGGEEILGFARREIDGKLVETLFGLGPGYLDEIRRRLLARRRFRFERFFEKRDGTRIFLGTAASNLQDKQGNPLGYLFIFQDLTEIHAMEQEMRLKERMVALGEMAAGMAHELRNPLAAISGAVQFLKGELRPAGETLELMDIILRESQRLDQAIRDFLTFARPGTFASEPVDLVKLIDDSVKLMRRSREFTAGHRIETRYPGDGLCCDADPNRLRQVFWNLATNALKSMPDGGTLTIALDCASDDDQIRIRFEDQGRGMSESERRRYFQPFNSSFDEGTGLGAAIVYRLVQEHGGRIQLESSPGEGTRVWIVLPRGSRRAGPVECPAAPLMATGG